MYNLKITINQSANLNFFNKWLTDNYSSNYSGFTQGQKLFIFFKTEPDEQTKTDIESFYISLSDSDVIIGEEIIKIYEQRKIDGQAYFFQAKAEYFGVKLRDGILTSENVNYIYTKLEKPERMINNGDWEPALYAMINDISTTTQEDIDNGYTQEIHDNIINDINNYLNQ